MFSHSPFWPVRWKPGGGFARNYPALDESRTKHRASGLGITRERLALVETAFGATAVTTLEAPDVAQALGQIIASDLPFDVWYRERLQELHGVNLAGYEQFAQRTPLPQNQEVHFEWTLNSNLGG